MPTPVDTGRRLHFDERSRAYDIANMLGSAPPVLARNFWPPRVRALDQSQGPKTPRGQSGCVGFSWAHELAADPVRVPVDHNTALDLYYSAQARDPWEDHDERGGTAILFAAQEAQARGYIASYSWAFTVDDLLVALINTGPVVLGSAWPEGMFDTTRQGVVHPRGPLTGLGHAYLAYGYDLSKRFRIGHNKFTKRRAYLACQNSYGPGYGVDGRFWLPLDEWEDDLMHHPQQPAEACIPRGRRAP